MGVNSTFFDILNDYIEEGNNVAEFYHGEKDDILKGLSKLIGDSGTVYGVDSLNPFEDHPNMQNLKEIPNIHLKKTTMPYLPDEVSDLDAIIIREFIWTYPIPIDGRENPDIYSAINSAIKFGGYLIMPLNKTEEEQESGRYTMYQNTIGRQLPLFSKVYHQDGLMIYQKQKKLRY
ncbi:MAG: hypothetical protein K0B02_03480 [DPANN group archaeon]|nr:hypothetical protein [DPANN group archaeon]